VLGVPVLFADVGSIDGTALGTIDGMDEGCLLWLGWFVGMSLGRALGNNVWFSRVGVSLGALDEMSDGWLLWLG